MQTYEEHFIAVGHYAAREKQHYEAALRQGAKLDFPIERIRKLVSRFIREAERIELAFHAGIGPELDADIRNGTLNGIAAGEFDSDMLWTWHDNIHDVMYLGQRLADRLPTLTARAADAAYRAHLRSEGAYDCMRSKRDKVGGKYAGLFIRQYDAEQKAASNS